MISSLVQENISPWGSEQKTDRTPDRTPDRIGSDFGSDRTGIFAIDAELLFWEGLFSQRHRWLGIRNNGSDILSVIRLLTTSRRYRTLLIPAILIIVSSEIFREAFSLGSVKNGRSNRVKLCSRKFPSADQLKIILCDGFRAYGEF